MSKPNPQYVDKFTSHYFKTMLWSESDNTDDQGGDPLEDNYDVEDFDLDTLREHSETCKQFVTDNWGDLEDLDAEHAGHNFWLTRRGHGAGFWDGDYEEAVGERLTASCNSEKYSLDYACPFVGDDGKLYIE